MNFKKLNILLIVFTLLLGANNTLFASDSESDSGRYGSADNLESSVEKATSGTNFNGSVMISQKEDDEYNVLYQDAVGTDGGYDIDTVYDVGSVSKLYTTTAIMLLEEDGKLNYNDKITKYFDDVPEAKQGVTIKMLLTHTSGIYADENEDHDVTKEEEISRIMNSSQKFEPGSDYLYSNAGFTLLAGIIEEASGQTYEDYLTENIFNPLGLQSTGFPNSDYLQDQPAVSGTLDGKDYGKVTDFDFGWHSKGYADVLTTPRELTYFFQAVINKELIGKKNLKLMDSGEIDIGGDFFRGYGTDVKHLDTEREIVGHSGIWYGGNTAAYYRPSDQVLFILACDQLSLKTEDLPANYVFNTLAAMYPSGSLDDIKAVDTVQILPAGADESPQFDVDVTPSSADDFIDPMSKQDVFANFKVKVQQFWDVAGGHIETVAVMICIVLIGMLSYILYYRLIGHKKWL